MEKYSNMLHADGWDRHGKYWSKSDVLGADGQPLYFTTDEAYDMQARPDLADFVHATAMREYAKRLVAVHKARSASRL